MSKIFKAVAIAASMVSGAVYAQDIAVSDVDQLPSGTTGGDTGSKWQQGTSMALAALVSALAIQAATEADEGSPESPGTGGTGATNTTGT